MEPADQLELLTMALLVIVALLALVVVLLVARATCDCACARKRRVRARVGADDELVVITPLGEGEVVPHHKGDELLRVTVTDKVTGRRARLYCYLNDSDGVKVYARCPKHAYGCGGACCDDGPEPGCCSRVLVGVLKVW